MEQIKTASWYRTIIFRYLKIIVYVIFCFATSLIQRSLALSDLNNNIQPYHFEASVIRGIITQVQMLASLFLVLNETKAGFVTAIVENVYYLLTSSMFLLQSDASLPGVISYIGVIIILSLVNEYKIRTTALIKEIEKNKREIEKSEKRLHQTAYFDSLTQLPNRNLYMDRLAQSIYRAKRNATMIGVIFIDLDGFKGVNDTMGHLEGDKVIKELVNRLVPCIRKEDTFARFGGDKFLLQAVDIHNVDSLEVIVQKLTSEIKKAFIVQGMDFFISASIGISIYPIDGEEASVLVKNAEIAMYTAKNRGKNQHVFCSPEMKNDVVTKMRLTNKLYLALAKNEFFMNYQPQVNSETGQIVGFESLIRWNNGENGIVSPVQFIPLAEKTGLIKPIGLWIVKTVCEQWKQFEKNVSNDCRMSINISLEQLKDKNIVSEISSILTSTQTDPKNIQVEITESIAFNEEPFVLKRLFELKELGLSIAIDDFGTGYSSLTRLKKFPIDLLKIDIDFVRGISANSQKDKAIIIGTIRIAESLGMKTLAEGVETHEQFTFLKDAKCDEIQGYYFFKPLGFEEVKELVAK
ncbi:MAG: EAL domain-containing protein [Fibrobacter sp.]|nr:EAL domain-containing protein [Fibrobacter sp.]